MTQEKVSDLVARRVLLVEDGNHGEYRPRPDEFVETGVPFIRAADMSSGTIDFVGAGKINAVARTRIRKGIGKPGDVILSHKGTVGRVAVAPMNSPDFVCSPQTTFWRSLDPTVLDQRYLRYAMQSPSFARQLEVLKGQTDMAPYVSLTDQRAINLELPPIGEQRAIGEVLGALDDKIAVNELIIKKVKDLLAAEFTSLQENGESDSVSISELVDLNPKVQKPAAEEPVYLDMKNLPDRAMTVTSWSYRAPRGGARFQNGDTLLARITPCLENGKIGYVDFLADNGVGIGSTEFIVMRPRKGIPAAFPYFLAIDTTFREFAIKRMVGTSGRQRLSAGDIANFQVRRPNEHDLARFSKLSDALLGRVKATVDETRTLAAARDVLLPLLMSGKVRVTEAEKVVEGVV